MQTHLPGTLDLDSTVRQRLLALLRCLLVEGDDDEDGSAERDGNRRPFRGCRLPALTQASWKKRTRSGSPLARQVADQEKEDVQANDSRGPSPCEPCSAPFEGPATGCSGCSIPSDTGLCSRDLILVDDNKRLVPALATAGARQTTLGARRSNPGPRMSSCGPRRMMSRFLNRGASGDDEDGGWEGGTADECIWRAGTARLLRSAGTQRGMRGAVGILGEVEEREQSDKEEAWEATTVKRLFVALLADCVVSQSSLRSCLKLLQPTRSREGSERPSLLSQTRTESPARRATNSSWSRQESSNMHTEMQRRRREPG